MTNIPTNSMFTFMPDDVPGAEPYNDIIVKLQEIEQILDARAIKSCAAWLEIDLAQFFYNLVPEDFI